MDFQAFKAEIKASTNKEGKAIVGTTASGREVAKYYVVSRVEDEVTGAVGSRLLNLWGKPGIEGVEHEFSPSNWSIQSDEYTNEETGQVYVNETLVPRT